MQIAIPLFPRFTALDAIGPYEVLQRIPSIEVTFVGHERGEVRSDNGMLGITVDATFEELPAPDILVFPGGVGTRPLVHDERVLDWVRHAHESTTYTTSVCTGSLVLGGAGLLNGLTATTHWACYPELEATGAVPTARARRRAPRPADHHRRRGVERHRHGPAARRAVGRPHRRAGCAADDRVRPAATVRLRRILQVRRRRRRAGGPIRPVAQVADSPRGNLERVASFRYGGRSGLAGRPEFLRGGVSKGGRSPSPFAN